MKSNILQEVAEGFRFGNPVFVNVPDILPALADLHLTFVFLQVNSPLKEIRKWNRSPLLPAAASCWGIFQRLTNGKKQA